MPFKDQKYKTEYMREYRATHPEKMKSYEERHKTRAREFRRKRREEIVKSMGGKCSRCGYNKCLAALDWHHKNPEIKERTYRKRCLSEMKIEADKCILLCANCHREEHHKDFISQ